ncbi:hypothetical protein EC957_006939 [Mortierella hygrophila]|uniref:Uncharacterized protein n=1 Tax=Mortierella hygrophila TaxID=979708 RepID=A0A9P6JYU3_9FUNG|nr:hypothetical protein EC957_006939 [Mortierella hygrophila]
MKSCPPPRLFRISELAILVASHLTRGDISRLMRTSQQMYHTMAPIFFHNLSTSFHFKRDDSGMLENSRGLEALARNAHHVREWDTGILFFNYYYHASAPFRTSNNNNSIAPTAVLRAAPPRPPLSGLVQLIAPRRPNDVYELTALPQMTWLTRIDLNLIWNPRECNCRYPFPDYLNARTTLVRICEILRLLPRLCQLDICGLVINDSGSARLFTSTLLETTQLRRLNITLSRQWTYPGIRTLLFDNLPPSIERLYIGGTNSCALAGDSGPEADNADNRAMEAAQDPVRSTTKLANLQDLALDEWQESTTKEQFLSVFERCLGLKTLRLKQPSAPAGMDGADIGRICPDIRDISYDGSLDMDGNDKWLFEVMASLPENQMESLEFQSASRSRLDDVTAIKITSPVASSAVRMILEMCKALEVLQISRSTVHLCDAIASPWACTKMTNLTLSIKISPSSSPPGTEFVPSYLQNPSTPLSAAEKDIFTQLEVFYQQIGKLTGLRHLYIGRAEYSEHGLVVGRSPSRDRPLPGMLILSTNRADRPGFLDVLGGLSKLETVGGAIFPETVEGEMPEFTSEFSWICEHWRSLRQPDFLLQQIPRRGVVGGYQEPPLWPLR